ncbi:uncharacterized protein LOC127852555 [Dreissena polymorpha]|uniref:Uncharacterized protein n=1 Tax=Dreissena polymorpha TaxID=45954 RepID=A0A9D4CP71_DREPO|nr:uncharacterized protein LOC127852555 [Dreissena polymorpha]KAH3727716.1 hypothetical protein DPMN_053659 [Dreissena polymorpha]
MTQPCAKTRIVILGSKFVGKTTIADWFAQKQRATELQSTKSHQHVLKTPDIIVTEVTKLSALTNMNIRRADALVLVYAVNDSDSFENMCFMRDTIVNIHSSDFPIVVVGNKKDILERKVHPVVADCLVTIDWEHPHVEVSAKNGDDELKAIFDKLFLHLALTRKSLQTGTFGCQQTMTIRRKTMS